MGTNQYRLPFCLVEIVERNCLQPFASKALGFHRVVDDLTKRVHSSAVIRQFLFGDFYGSDDSPAKS